MLAVELGVTERGVEAAEQKDRLGRTALDQLPADGGSIVLDAGTTTRRLVTVPPNDRRSS